MKSILQVCAFGAPNPGNFMASLIQLQGKMHEEGYETIYAFPEKARGKEWCRNLAKTNKVYFLPEAKARILPKTYRIFRQIYKENQIQILHSHFELYDVPATITAPKNVKVFWHLHDALKENYEKGSFSRKLLTRIQYGNLGKRAVLLSVSKEHAHFANKLGFNKNQILYFPNGINTKRIRPISKLNDAFQFLMFGWDVKRKGVDLAVEAMNRLNSKQVVIKIVGEKECQAYLMRHQVPGIIYQKPVKDVNELYSQAAGFLHISRAEGLSYALLEAIYAGLPIICSDIPENLFAKEFRNIIFVKSGNSNEIVNAIKKMVIEYDTYTKENMEHNQEIIEKKYSLDSWCKKLLKLYLNLR